MRVLNIWNWNTLLLKKKFRNKMVMEHINTNLIAVDSLAKRLLQKIFNKHSKRMSIMESHY